MAEKATQSDRLKQVEEAVTKLLKLHSDLEYRLGQLDGRVSTHHATPDAHHPAIVARKEKK